MQVYRPIKIKNIENSKDVFVPISYKCKTCKKKVRAIFIDVFLQDLYGAQLDCFTCGEYWADVMDPLGGEDRKLEPIRVSLSHFS